MDRAGNKLFASSGLTRNKNRRIGWRNLGNARENSLQSRRGSNDLLEHRGPVDFIAESNIFLLQLLFSPLEVFDIGTRNVPTKDLSLVIANWIETSQKPAVTSIALAIPHFAFKSRAARHGTVPSSLDPFQIIGMIYSAAEAFEPLPKSKA